MAGIGDVLAKTAGKGAGVSTVSMASMMFHLIMLHSFYHFMHCTFEIVIYTANIL